MPLTSTPSRKQFWLDKQANAERTAELDRKIDSQIVDSWLMRFHNARNQLCA